MNNHSFDTYDPNEEDDLEKPSPIEPVNSTKGNEEETDEVEDDDNEDWDNDYDRSDPMDSYGTSGEKYGWYNGFSDDVIDDAFDGDPEATRNVD